jgi:hypothetical protein
MAENEKEPPEARSDQPKRGRGVIVWGILIVAANVLAIYWTWTWAVEIAK